MDKWKPDLELIGKIEKVWKSDGCIDNLIDHSFGDMTIQEVYDNLRKDGSDELAEYLANNFDLNNSLCKPPYTIGETIEEMKKGTPLGILTYSVMVGAYLEAESSK